MEELDLYSTLHKNTELGKVKVIMIKEIVNIF